MAGRRFVPRLWAPPALAFALSAMPALAQEGGPPFDVYELSIPQLQAAMERGTLTSAQLVDAYVARIRAYDQFGPALNSIVFMNPRARLEAQVLDEERALQGPRGPLHGIPVLLKDNFDARGMPTTAGSVALSGMMPPDDSWVVRRLRDAGAIILGKTNMDELAIGITAVSSIHGQTRNPYNLTRNPGGSSGGTGVAIAASFAALGYGTDTCGSVRIPAAFNALFGLRPTRGLIGSDGIVPVAHSLDAPGPMARSVVDLAIGLDAVLGGEASDLSVTPFEGGPPRFVEALHRGALDGVRIGVLGEHFKSEWTTSEVLTDVMNTLALGDSVGGKSIMDAMREGADESRALDEVFEIALARLKGLGAKIVRVEISGLDDLFDAMEIIDQEFKSDFEAYLAGTPDAPVDSLGDILVRGLYHPSVEESLIVKNQSTYPNSPEHDAALGRMAQLRDTLIQAFARDRLDAIAYPTMRRAPAELGRPQWGTTCLLSSSSGLPAITIPAGIGPAGGPAGLELLGLPMDDARLVAFAFDYEQATSPRIPPESTPPLSAAAGRVAQPR